MVGTFTKEKSDEEVPFYIAGYQEHSEIGKHQKGYHVTNVSKIEIRK